MLKTKLIKLLSLTMLFLFLFVACAPQEELIETPSVPKEEPVKNVSLPFDSEAGYNPYIINNILTQNNSGLIFCKPLQLDPSFNIEYMASDSVTINGLEVTVVMNNKYRFSDGTPVTVDDFIASLEAARVSLVYGDRFSNIKKISAEGNTAIITLSKPDSLFHLLLDIPILKASDVASKTPMCSGRYTYGTSNTLVPNEANDYDIPKHLSTIDLTSQNEYAALLSSLNIGAIDFLSSQNESDISSNTITIQGRYTTNNLIYLGFDSVKNIYPIIDVDGVVTSIVDASTIGERFFSNASARVAISELINRRVLAEKGYFSKANIATGILNNSYTFLNLTNTFSDQGDTNLAVNTITSLGYEYDETESYFYGDNGERLTLSLLCYSGNSYKRYVSQLIADQLEAIGIDVIVDEENSFEIYNEKVASGNFDMYIGEIKLYNNMDMSAFFTDEGIASSQLAVSDILIETYDAFKLSTDNAQAFQQQFAQDMPFAPILWYEGTVFYSKEYDGLTPSISDVFYNFQDIVLKSSEEVLLDE